MCLLGSRWDDEQSHLGGPKSPKTPILEAWKGISSQISYAKNSNSYIKFHVNLIHRSEDIAIWIFRIWYLAWNAFSGLQNRGFGGLWTPKCYCSSSRPQKAHPCVNPRRIVCASKSEAEVTNNKKTALEVLYYWRNEANYWQTRSIARRLCDSRASCWNPQAKCYT